MSFKATFEVAAFKDSGNVRFDIGINEGGLANNSCVSAYFRKYIEKLNYRSFRVLCYIHTFFSCSLSNFS